MTNTPFKGLPKDLVLVGGPDGINGTRVPNEGLMRVRFAEPEKLDINSTMENPTERKYHWYAIHESGHYQYQGYY